jgi:hypothetical protein
MSARDTEADEARLLGLLGPRTVAYRVDFVKVAGSVSGAVWLSQALFYQRGAGPGVWWDRTAETFETATGINARQQHRTRKKLVDAGVLKEHRRGQPARLFYQVSAGALAALLLPQKCETGSDKTVGLDRTKRSVFPYRETIEKKDIPQPAEGGSSDDLKEGKKRPRPKRSCPADAPVFALARSLIEEFPARPEGKQGEEEVARALARHGVDVEADGPVLIRAAQIEKRRPFDRDEKYRKGLKGWIGAGRWREIAKGNPPPPPLSTASAETILTTARERLSRAIVEQDKRRADPRIGDPDGMAGPIRRCHEDIEAAESVLKRSKGAS